jgi:hypothetical protein
MTESGDPVMTESEQAQAPTWRVFDNTTIVRGRATERSFEVFGHARHGAEAERMAAKLNRLQTSLSEANAEVTRLRGALEEIVHRARPSALSSPPDEDMERIARAALAREEPVAREVCPYCMTSTGGEVRNPDCPVHGFQPLVREENP